MKSAMLHNFHLPLPTPVYQRLKQAAEQRQLPATQVAKQALESWLDEQERLTLHEELAAYAADVAGSTADLDEPLAAAALVHLADDEPQP
jgi:predicted DNA-binding protein